MIGILKTKSNILSSIKDKLSKSIISEQRATIAVPDMSYLEDLSDISDTYDIKAKP